MRDQADKIRQEVQQKYEEIKSLNAQLETIEKACKHSWEAVVYTPVEHRAYDMPDMHFIGVGSQGREPRMTHVPARQEKRWSRTCHNCGKTENSGRTRHQTVAGHIPGTTANAEVPDFGDEPPSWIVRG